MPKTKPNYEFIRYDIRPSSGLTDVESDYIIKCVNDLENHPNVQEVQACFELPSAQSRKRSSGKHCHLGIRFKKAIRTDKVPIFKISRLITSKQSVKTCTSELYTVGEYWKMGYIEKDGQHFGRCKAYHQWWLEHERAIKCKVRRAPDMTCGTIVNDVVNWWYQSHVLIKKKHDELTAKPTTFGVQKIPVDIRHVYAHYVITFHPNVRMNNRISRRLWLAQTTWSDYETLVRMATDTDMLENPTPNGVYESAFEVCDRKYNPMDKIYPIDGEY